MMVEDSQKESWVNMDTGWKVCGKLREITWLGSETKSQTNGGRREECRSLVKSTKLLGRGNEAQTRNLRFRDWVAFNNSP